MDVVVVVPVVLPVVVASASEDRVGGRQDGSGSASSTPESPTRRPGGPCPMVSRGGQTEHRQRWPWWKSRLRSRPRCRSWSRSIRSCSRSKRWSCRPIRWSPPVVVLVDVSSAWWWWSPWNPVDADSLAVRRGGRPDRRRSRPSRWRSPRTGRGSVPLYLTYLLLRHELVGRGQVLEVLEVPLIGPGAIRKPLAEALGPVRDRVRVRLGQDVLAEQGELGLIEIEPWRWPWTA